MSPSTGRKTVFRRRRVPADAVTASGSGLDPHISLQNAQLQIPRVAKERGISEEVVRGEVAKATDKPLLGIGGDPGVNVLRLNLALDAVAPKGPWQKRSRKFSHMRCGRPARSGGFRIGGPNFFVPLSGKID